MGRSSRTRKSKEKEDKESSEKFNNDYDAASIASRREETVTTPVNSPKKSNKGKKWTPKTRSFPRKKGKVNYKSLHEGNSDFEDEEIDIRRRGRKNGKKEKRL